MNSPPLVRNTGLQPTPTEVVVNGAARRMTLAPAGAVPPLVVGMVNAPVANTILVGAPARKRSNGAPFAAPSEPALRTASLEFAWSEVKRRVNMAEGVMGTTFGENILTAVPERDSFVASVPQVPKHLNSLEFRPGMHFNKGPSPRFEFALGNGHENTPAGNVGRLTHDEAVAQGIPAAVAQSMGATAKKAVERGRGKEAPNAVLRVAAANGVPGNKANEVARTTFNAVVLNKGGDVVIQNNATLV